MFDWLFGTNATSTQKVVIVGGLALAAWYAFK